MSARTIEVDDEVFEEMQSRAEPLVDTPNTVLRRLLGLEGEAEVDRAAKLGPKTPGTQRGSRAPRRTVGIAPRAAGAGERRRAAHGTIAPEAIYRLPILESLVERGGRAPKREVLEAVGKRVADQLLDADHEMMGNEPRWMKRAQFVRLRLIREGLMAENSPRGVWEISNQGSQLVTAGAVE